MPRADEQYPEVLATSREAWRDWLERNHATSTGVWLVRYKKGSGKPHLEYDALVEEALCLAGSTAAPTPSTPSVRRSWSRRASRSGWSRVNKARIERLLADGRMTPAGLARIEAAKADELLDGAGRDRGDGRAPRSRRGAAHRPGRARRLGAVPAVREETAPAVDRHREAPRERSRRVAEMVAGAKAGRNPIAYVPKERR